METAGHLNVAWYVGCLRQLSCLSPHQLPQALVKIKISSFLLSISLIPLHPFLYGAKDERPTLELRDVVS